QPRRADLSPGRAERGVVAEARQPRLCAGKRPRHACRQRQRAVSRRPGAQRLFGALARASKETRQWPGRKSFSVLALATVRNAAIQDSITYPTMNGARMRTPWSNVPRAVGRACYAK